MARTYYLDDHFGRERQRRRAVRKPRLPRNILAIPTLAALVLAYVLISPETGLPSLVPARSVEVLSGRVSHIRDGDTIEVLGTPVRIANLDCAEMNTAAGRRARARVVALLSHQQAVCQLEGRRSYDREVGTCALPDGRDLGEVLIAEGICRRWR